MKFSRCITPIKKPFGFSPIALIFILFMLTACGSSDEFNALKGMLYQVNTSKWDKHSQQKFTSTIDSAGENDFSSLKKAAYILMTHSEEKKSRDVFQYLNQIKSDPSVLYQLSKLELNAENFESALKYSMDGASTTNTKDKIQFYLLRTEILLEQGEFESAQNTLKAIFKISPQSVEGTYFQAKLNLLQGNCNEAIKNFNSVLKVLPNLKQIYSPLSSAYRMCGKTKEANKLSQIITEETFQFQNQFDSEKNEMGNPLLYLKNQVKVFFSRQDYDRAISTLEKIIVLEPELADNHLNLGSMYYQKRQFGKAKEYFLKAHKLDAENVKPLINLGNIEIYSNNYQQAEKYFEKAIQINPKHPKILRNFSTVELKLNNTEKYMELMKQLISMQPDDFTIKKAYLSGLISLQRKEDANKQLENWIQTAKNDEEFVRLAAFILENPHFHFPNTQQPDKDTNLLNGKSNYYSAVLLLLQARNNPGLEVSHFQNEFIKINGLSESSKTYKSFTNLLHSIRNNEKPDLNLIR